MLWPLFTGNVFLYICWKLVQIDQTVAGLKITRSSDFFLLIWRVTVCPRLFVMIVWKSLSNSDIKVRCRKFYISCKVVFTTFNNKLYRLSSFEANWMHVRQINHLDELCNAVVSIYRQYLFIHLLKTGSNWPDRCWSENHPKFRFFLLIWRVSVSRAHCKK